MGTPPPARPPFEASLPNSPPKRAAGHRYNISQGRLGFQHTEETRRKIGESLSATRRGLRRDRLAARAAAAAEQATADLRAAFTATSTVGAASYTDGDYSDSEGEDEDGVPVPVEEAVLDMFALEKAVIGMTSLKRQLSTWMDAYEQSKFILYI